MAIEKRWGKDKKEKAICRYPLILDSFEDKLENQTQKIRSDIYATGHKEVWWYGSFTEGDKRRKLISISKEGSNGKYQIKWI